MDSFRNGFSLPSKSTVGTSRLEEALNDHLSALVENRDGPGVLIRWLTPQLIHLRYRMICLEKDMSLLESYEVDYGLQAWETIAEAQSMINNFMAAKIEELKTFRKGSKTAQEALGHFFEELALRVVDIEIGKGLVKHINWVSENVDEDAQPHRFGSKSDNNTQPKPRLEAKSEPATPTFLKTKRDSSIQTKPRLETQSEPTTPSGPTTNCDSSTRTEPGPETKSEPTTPSGSTTKCDSSTRTEPGSKTKPEPTKTSGPKTNRDSSTQTEPGSETKPEPTMSSGPKTNCDSSTQTMPGSEDKSEPTKTNASETKPDNKIQPNSGSESKSEETKSETEIKSKTQVAKQEAGQKAEKEAGQRIETDNGSDEVPGIQTEKTMTKSQLKKLRQQTRKEEDARQREADARRGQGKRQGKKYWDKRSKFLSKKAGELVDARRRLGQEASLEPPTESPSKSIQQQSMQAIQAYLEDMTLSIVIKGLEEMCPLCCAYETVERGTHMFCQPCKASGLPVSKGWMAKKIMHMDNDLEEKSCSYCKMAREFRTADDEGLMGHFCGECMDLHWDVVLARIKQWMKHVGL